MLANIIDIKTIGDSESGSLSFFEAPGDLPFEVKRVYYTYDVPVGVKRGMHAHRNLQQILICPHGAIEVILDDGRERESVLLDSPSKGLVLGSMVWREMVWREPNSVLVVAASMPYDEADYIRDYGEFLKAASD